MAIGCRRGDPVHRVLETHSGAAEHFKGIVPSKLKFHPDLETFFLLFLKPFLSFTKRRNSTQQRLKKIIIYLHTACVLSSTCSKEPTVQSVSERHNYHHVLSQNIHRRQMYTSTQATEDILAVNKVLSLCIRDKLDCRIFWTLR